MLEELLEHLNQRQTLIGGSKLGETMQKVAIETQRQLGKINHTYKTDLEMKHAVEQILGHSLPDTVRIRQPFYMDFGKNIEFGENVFVNASVHMQDQGGIRIGNNALIGHQVVFATLDHDLATDRRGDLHPAPIILEDDVWIGANSVILKGITIGEGSVVAAGSVVTKDIPKKVVVGGNPARVIKNYKRREKEMNKPYVIIHTHTSIDGNLDIMNLPEFQEASRQYQELALDPQKQQFDIQGYLNGKITTEDNMTHYKKPLVDENAAPVPAGDYIVDTAAPMYYLSIDARGELAFEENYSSYGGIDSHIVEVLTEQVTNAYKDFLRKKEISYIIAGKEEIDYDIMLEKFYNLFGIRRMMIGGGGTLNWSFIQEDLVDEISVILAPIANGDPGGHRFFAAKEPYSSIQEIAFKLKAVEELEQGTLWIRYSVKE